MNKKRVVLFFTILLPSIVLAEGAFVEARKWLGDMRLLLQEDIVRYRNVRVPMRDGVELNTTVMLPRGHVGPLPTILSRTTYAWEDYDWLKYFVSQGYAVVSQHVRGRFKSEGQYFPHRYSGVDGYDTIEWIVRQPWANGRVGSFGCSYLGESQIVMAAEKHPNHIAMIVDGAGGAIGNADGSYGYFGVFENGVFNLASALGWFTESGASALNQTPVVDNYVSRLRELLPSLPVSDIAEKLVPFATGFDNMVSHELRNPWWQKQGYISEDDTFATATLHVNNWFDQTVHDSFRLASHMVQTSEHDRARHQHLVIAPGIHCSSAALEPDFSVAGDMSIAYQPLDFKQLYTNWFDYWLKGEERKLPPKYMYYQIHGEGWLATSKWPPENTVIKHLYFTASHKLVEKEFDLAVEQTGSLQYTYDPSNPVPTLGGTACCTGDPDEKQGPVDQRSLDNRRDILRFTSEVLVEPLDLQGSVKARLFVSTSAVDTDFTVKLIDLYPDGSAYNLHDGVGRLRYRNGIAGPELAKPGQRYELEVELRPLAYRFLPGHRLRVDISSSNFPRLARNLNTGKNNLQTAEYLSANNQLYMSAEYPSSLSLPVSQSEQ